ncbi:MULTISPECIES: hypothetical protein [Bradyrhizobium]|uniref:Chemotaxis protein n=2 Tax=Bradyrhizobium TaxID=374 RepID=A0ABY0QG99_9BRAD|nr:MULTISPECIES: hypothetical protein [Bradyrhizobium]SDK27662.1 hypothetical protein SAMN05444163_7700 [Bradyrhizobium ottawaense]SEE42666.1 hypothetical protein SAMN05444171_7433 [Bradyrhizobium lablabi]
MDALKDFLTKAADLYLAAPAFFNWAAPIFIAAIGGLIGLAYWLGGKFADSEINGLKAQMAALDQRFSLAKEQTAVSAKEASDLKSQLEKLQHQITNRESTEVLTESSRVLTTNLNRMISANNAAQGYLVSTGFDKNGELSWRPMTKEEARAEVDYRIKKLNDPR